MQLLVWCGSAILSFGQTVKSLRISYSSRDHARPRSASRSVTRAPTAAQSWRGPLTAFEIKSVLKEIRAIGNLNRSGSLPDDVLARVNRIIRQAASEASKIAARLHLRKLH